MYPFWGLFDAAQAFTASQVLTNFVPKEALRSYMTNYNQTFTVKVGQTDGQRLSSNLDTAFTNCATTS